MPRRQVHHRTVGLLAATVVAAAAVVPMPAALAASPAVVTISQTPTGATLSAGSLGVSYEASDLALPAFTSGNLASYLKTLGSSVMRIGGNTVDQTFWTSTGETAPSWSIATITPADLTALNTLAKASGWKVILGVNMKHYDPARAADEATHAAAALGSSLQAVEIGNEPDLYSQYKSDTAKYFTDFQAYVSAITKAVPGVHIEGSDAAGSPTGSFQTAFVSAESGLPHPNIVELTGHYYPLSDCSSSSNPTIAQLLGTTVRNSETTAADGAASQAKKLGLPAVFDEGNSVVCEGMPGVSDVYASALWEIDEQLAFAREGVSGDYMHGTVLQCDTGKPLFMYYTPLCAPTAADASTGTLAAQPEYYGLAAVHETGTGDFLNVTNPAWASVRAYAVKHTDGTMTVVLDNVTDPATTGPTTLQLNLGATFASGSRIDLTASALTAKTGITLGGQTVQSNGSLPAPTKTPITVSGSTLTVSIPAGSAALITLSAQSSGGGTTTTLVGGLSGKCLSVTGGSTAAGATADINTCDGSASQNWTLNANGTIVGGLSGKCLEVTNGSTADRAAVDIGTCTGAANQQWAVHSGGTVVGAQSGKCLSVLGASTADGAAADIYACNGSPSENWTER
ncbi:glycosyl hydrolase family protein [Actinocrinis sp.]|uniref:glycosyl hydrolase family protein n=1 Tax=Actinocrinis sp. TaxID=1920516 RepID=UPI002B6A5882|nr:glycosyl hydrolase family protein [Actinocrinis sp.]HXR73545.1 glycosyl hydrolase family protein [Actinocrinis sp.]